MRNRNFLMLLLGAMAISTSLGIGYQMYNNVEQNKSNLLSMNIEALANEESSEYAWSYPIDCPGLSTGDYCVCEENGPGNSCNNPGGKTCDCGKNCK